MLAQGRALCEVPKYEVFSGPYSVRIQENTDQKKIPYLDNFHALVLSVEF